MKSLEEYIQQAAKGGHTRSGMILGIRMALLGLQELAIKDPREHHRNLVIIVEIDRCLPDALEMVAGCRLGNRTLKLRDMGKMAATFVDLKAERAVRLAAREGANKRAREMSPLQDKEDALTNAYRTLSDGELFTRRFVRVALAPVDIPGYWATRQLCAECGESISFGREVVEAQRTLCRSCAGETYYEPL